MAARIPFREVQLQADEVPGARLRCPEVAAHSVPELRRFLEVRGIHFRRNARKCDLIPLVENAINQENIDPSVDGGRILTAKENQQRRSDLNVAAAQQTSDFDVFPVTWKTFQSVPIPVSFNEGKIYEHIIVRAQIEAEPEDSSYDSDNSDEESMAVPVPQKPLRRGKLFFVSGHVQNLKDALSRNGHYCLKSEVRASMNSTIYSVVVMLHKSSGEVLDASCHCKASAMSRCSHVSALLYTLDDYTLRFGYALPSCTSVVCQWNRGRRARSSCAIYENKYTDVREPSRVKRFKVLPSEDEPQTITDALKYACELRAPTCMWTMTLRYSYEDYEISYEHARVLLFQVMELREALKCGFQSPHEIAQTVGQSESDLWHTIRTLMITASKCSTFLSGLGDPFNKIKKLMYGSNRRWTSKYTDYGIKNESKAICEYEAITGVRVTRTGLWVNPRYPGLGASPDGLVPDGLIEVKCPYVLRDASPTDVHLLSPQQRSAYCLKKDGDTFGLKRTHKYWRQVQVQMGVTERDWCDFVVWTPANVYIERIYRDESWWAAASKMLLEFHWYYICPEYFENRIPRELPPIHLLFSAVVKLA